MHRFAADVGDSPVGRCIDSLRMRGTLPLVDASIRCGCGGLSRCTIASPKSGVKSSRVPTETVSFIEGTPISRDTRVRY
eukprot:1176873-Prorocentrum_minimum.AAC.2